MKWYLYKHPDGRAEVTEYRIPAAVLFERVFVRELDTPISTINHIVTDAGGVVPKPLSYAEERRQVYPSVADQLDALWHAMDEGGMPKAEPFYSDILAVKQQFPKS